MTSSSCNKNGCKESAISVGDLKYYIRQLEAKFSLYDEVAEEKQQLKKQLDGLSTWMENEMNKQKAMFARLINSHEEVWSMYQSTKRGLVKSKAEIETRNTELLELNESNAKLKDQAKQLERQNEYLEEKLQCREKSLCEELANIDMVRAKSEDQNTCLEQQSEQITRNERTVEEQSEHLSKLKTELRIIKANLDLQRQDYTRLKNEEETNGKETTEKIKNLQSQMVSIMKEKTEIDEVLRQQNCKLQELDRQMVDTKKRKHELECILNDERRQVDERIANLEKDKSGLEAAAKSLNSEMAECVRESERLKCENDQMSKLAEELQNKLRETVECNDKKTWATEAEIQTVLYEKNNLQGELDAMNHKTSRIEEELSNARQVYAAQTENVCELKRTLADLQFSQSLVPNSMNVCPDKTVHHQLGDYSKELDKITTVECKKTDGSFCSKVNPENLDYLVKELNTISDSLAQSSPC